jgi:putative tryptophan/tyrosine transport system substrate-binding protein
MRRRDFGVAAVGALIGSARFTVAQSRMPHLVYLWLGPADSDSASRKGLQAGLRKLGYQEGRNIRVDYRYADGNEARLAELAGATVAEQPDIIVTSGTVVTRSVARQTTTIPIVSISGDPVGSGFVASLARPGGNITGLTVAVGPELAGKWLQLIVEIVPGARRIAVLRNALNPIGGTQLMLMRAAADQLGGNIAFDEYRISAATEIGTALDAIGRAKPDAVTVDNDPLLASKAAEIAAVKLPAISGSREFTDAGLLVTYGASIFDIYYRSASYIDRILKGDKPADLPVEQPVKFELVVNLKTAQALGLTIPPAILDLADQIIE